MYLSVTSIVDSFSSRKKVRIGMTATSTYMGLIL